MCSATSTATKPRPPPKKDRDAATPECGLSPTLIRARADREHSPLLAWSLVILCTSSFYLGPLLLLSPLALYPFVPPRVAGTMFCGALFLALHPVSPWPRFRKACQLFYQVFDFHHNMTPRLDEIAGRENRLSIIAMHPHAIIPLQGFVWGAICDQLLPHLYGYGCTTDGALVLPVLRHLLHWISAGSAKKKKVLTEMQTNGQNLFILPGGVAEIFLSHRRPSGDPSVPQTQTIKARRYGLMKMALQTGAVIYPAFVFGASDMLDQLARADKGDGSSTTASSSSKDKSKADSNATIRNSIGRITESLSRKIGGGLTLYYGQYFLPVPYTPRMSIVLGDPIYPVARSESDDTMRNVTGEKRTCVRVEDPTSEQVEELMDRYADALHRLFEQYKVEAGYPNDTLRVI